MTVRTGLETLLSSPEDWLGADQRVGLLANPTSVDRDLRSSIELMLEHPAISLVRLFGPEHGIRGDAQAGADVGDAVDSRSGLPVSNLYRHGGLIDQAIFDDVEVLIVDLQDIGCRFYTYLATADRASQAASATGIKVLVLDRPNPIAWMGAAGNVVTPGCSSLIGLEGLPVTHGCTIGEVLRFTARRSNRTLPEVVPLSGWKRSMPWHKTGQPWIPPSPNLPTLDTAHVYPGTCWIEGTNLSEGRGTTRPFEIIGAPWIDGHGLAAQLTALDVPGYAFRPVSFTPTFSKHAGKLCGGVQIHQHPTHNRSILSLGPPLLNIVHSLGGQDFEWVGSPERPFIDLLAGSPTLRNAVDNGEGDDNLPDAWTGETAEFVRQITPDLEYGPIAGQ